MSSLHLNRLWEFLSSIQLLMAMLWGGLAIFTVGLIILMYTRWGQYQPLRKCLAMSLLAHLLLAGYAATVQSVSAIPVLPGQGIRISLTDDPDDKVAANSSAPVDSKAKDQPWEVFPNDAIVKPDAVKLERGEADQPVEPKRLVRVEESKLSADPPVDHVALSEVKPLGTMTEAKSEAAGRTLPSESAAAIDAPPAQRREAAAPALPGVPAAAERLANEPSTQPVRSPSDDLPAALLQQTVPLPKMETDTPEPFSAVAARDNPLRITPAARVASNVADDAAYGNGAGVPDGKAEGLPGTEPNRLAAPSITGLMGKAPSGSEGRQPGPELVASSVPGLGLPNLARSRNSDSVQPVPDAYRLRIAPNRARVAESHGGTVETEAAVKAALKWLADNQSADGRWDPRTHDAGKDANVLGRTRQSAGSRADTGMTGLAMLSFLGSGHTHLDGSYREDVRRGLEYLIRAQAADGNLGGDAAMFEFMYCHAMATCALSEAYGMTHDPHLREPVRRAIGYTIAAQDPRGGGWRYRPGDAGDTSQLGWQLMSLKSAELAGIPVPDKTRQGIIHYLQSVASGRYGGRASYRPGEQPTRPMTAEALMCWQFLGLSREHPACTEASDFLLGEVPGDGVYNLYYWYYATLSLYQLQDARWQRWNDALRTALVSRQVKDGPQAGSWDTSDLWGGHGGRVYTTAVAALTLEVYYRFLPLYAGARSDLDQAR